jgi:hypothetical protein
MARKSWIIPPEQFGAELSAIWEEEARKAGVDEHLIEAGKWCFEEYYVSEPTRQKRDAARAEAIEAWYD